MKLAVILLSISCIALAVNSMIMNVQINTLAKEIHAETLRNNKNRQQFTVHTSPELVEMRRTGEPVQVRINSDGNIVETFERADGSKYDVVRLGCN